MRNTEDVRNALAAIELPDGDWLTRLDALEQAGLVKEIASAGRSRWRAMTGTVAEILELQDRERKSLSDAVQEAARSARGQQDEGPGEEEPDADSIAQILVALGRRDELFHDGAGTKFARVDHEDGGAETVVLGSCCHEEVLSLRLWNEYALPASSTSLHDATRTLKAIARADGPVRTVALRHFYDMDTGTLWYDLADERRRAVAITAAGWRLVERPPVYFLRHKNTMAQVEPVSGGNIDLLRPFVNVEDEAHWTLLVGWAVQAIFPGAPRYGLMLGGAQGSAKSTTAKMLRRIVDPARAPMTKLPRGEDDFAVVASTNAILAADNVSTMSRDMSDMLCACITGDGYARRTKYRDTDETVWEYQRPVLLNGIGNVLQYPDLLDRMLLVRCPAIRPRQRRTERELWGEFEEKRPFLLGAIFDAAAGVMQHRDAVNVPGDVRMADAAQTMMAVGRTLGWADERMLGALRGNAEDQIREAIEESLVARPLLNLLEEMGGTEGTMGTLLDQLNARVPEALRKERKWPRSPRALRACVDRIAPALARLGWALGYDRTSGSAGRDRVVWIEKSPSEDTVPTVLTDPPGDEGDGGDGCSPHSPTDGAGSPSSPGETGAAGLEVVA